MFIRSFDRPVVGHIVGLTSRDSRINIDRNRENKQILQLPVCRQGCRLSGTSFFTYSTFATTEGAR